jgi:hypothetical protein
MPALNSCTAQCATLFLACLVWAVTPVRAETCSAAQFASAVDKAGSALRNFTREAQPRLTARCEKLAAVKGWPTNDVEERCLDYLRDGRVAEFDTAASEHLMNIDQLGRVEAGTAPDCKSLKALERSGKELLEVMIAKSAYLTGKIDQELGAEAAAKETAADKTPPAVPKTPAASPRAPARDNSEVAAVREPPAEPLSQFETKIIPDDALVTGEEGYTIDEIREVTRGFFGTISTELASVIEHAFARSGRPTAYILGSEGGGALLAGLRYGKGTLYLRKGGSQPIYWHGPSIGYDIGGEGSRTLYLVYRLTEPEKLFRRFVAIDGSAYFVGGVGITFLKGGDVIMAPIRSGLGLRLGANIGYVGFSPRPTWNPF